MPSYRDLKFHKDTIFLVTGGAGFIGSNLCEAILEMGYHVRCLDNLSTGKQENVDMFAGIPQYDFIKGDITDFDTCLVACQDVDYVLHEAAWGSVPRSIEMPIYYEKVNIHGTLNMMEAARRGLDSVPEGKNTKLIAVTQLTSISQEILENELLIKEPLADVVKKYALNAKAAGLDGVVCSAHEAPIIKELGLISVTPGIRFADNSVDDQKRVATPALAKELGSTYIVVGRSITKDADPVSAYKRCVKEFC